MNIPTPAASLTKGNMDQELKERLLDSGDQLIKWAEAAASKGGNFVQEQAPLLAEEIVKWYFWTGVAYMTLAAVIAVSLTTFAIWAWRKTEPWPRNEYSVQPCDIVRGATFVASILSLLIGTCVFTSNLMVVIQAAVAPRLLILQTLHEMVK